MENKEKLLKLINACIDNKKFYNNAENRNFSIEHSQYKQERNTAELVLEYRSNEQRYVKYEDRCKYLQDNALNSNLKQVVKFPQAIKIAFDSEPPIMIVIGSRITKTEKVSDVEFKSGEGKWEEKEVSSFLFFKKKIKVQTYEKVPMIAKIDYLEYYPVITMGEMKAEITLDEFEELSKRILENKIKEKFPQVVYVDIEIN